MAIRTCGAVIALLAIGSISCRREQAAEPAQPPPAAQQPAQPGPLPSVPTPPSPPPKEEPIQTGPRSIWDAYQRNEVGGDNQFKGKRLRLTGVVKDMKKDALNTIVVEIASTNEGGALHARFEDQWAGEIGALERGQLLAIECTGKGLVLGTPQLAECAVRWRQPATLEPFALQLGASYELCLFEEAMPKILASLDAGVAPDGGPLPKNWSKMPKRFQQVHDDDHAALSKAGLQQLPCDHPALSFLPACDGQRGDGVPQCRSALFKAAWKYVHTGD